MVASGKVVKKKFSEKFLGKLREGLKEELNARREIAERTRQDQSAQMNTLRRTHHEVLSCEKERLRRRRLSSILSALRGLSWVS
ncbi:MAG: hypothetical protein QXO01_00160 [Nitrososphaerota archaeon]